jgi:hypothetical protein
MKYIIHIYYFALLFIYQCAARLKNGYYDSLSTYYTNNTRSLGTVSTLSFSNECGIKYCKSCNTTDNSCL